MTAEVRCAVPGTNVLGETPLWCDRTQSLLWLDVDAARLQRFHPASGRHDVFGLPAKHAGSLALTSNTSTVLLGLDLGLHLFDLGTGELRLLCEVEPSGSDNRLNDGRCDAQGRFWVGTMDNLLTRPTGSLYRVDPGGVAHHMLGDVIVSNTLALSPAQDRLYFSDTRRYTTWRFDVDAAGRLSRREVFADYTDSRKRPDGACVDAEGFVWIAIFAGGEVVRYAPDGRVDRVLDVPVTNPTCVCLGGPDYRTLFITTARKFLTPERLNYEPLAGCVLAVDVDVPGRPEHRFRV